MAKNKNNRVLNYVKDVKGELKKVTWPSFKQVRNNTLIVIVSVLIIGAIIWGLDALFGFGMDKAVNLANPTEPAEQTMPVEGTTTENPLDSLPVEMMPTQDTQPAEGAQSTEGAQQTENTENKPQ